VIEKFSVNKHITMYRSGVQHFNFCIVVSYILKATIPFLSLNTSGSDHSLLFYIGGLE
jgi:hypothetical protein